MLAEVALPIRARGAFPWAALALMALGAVPSDSRAQLLGPELQVNSFTSGDQQGNWVAAKRNGEFVVVWTSDGQDGDLGGVFGQRFGADDQALGGEFMVNQYTTGGVHSPRVAMDDGGRFMVTWSNSGYRQTTVPARRFDAAGQPLGGELEVASNTSWIRSGGMDLTAESTGNFVLLWYYVSPPGIPGFPDTVSGGVQRYDGAGQAAGSQAQVWGYSVASTGIGEFVVGVPLYEYQSPWSFRVDPGIQKYDAQGPVETAIAVDTEENWDLASPTRVASGGRSDFVVAWAAEPYLGSPSDKEVFLRRVSATSGPVGESVKVNTYSVGLQKEPSVAADRKGNFLVVWQSQDQDGSGSGIFGQRFTADGSALGGEFQVNSTTSGEQGAPSVAAGNVGEFIVSWTSANQDGSGSGVFARRVRSSVFWGGFELGDPCGWSSVVGASCP